VKQLRVKLEKLEFELHHLKTVLSFTTAENSYKTIAKQSMIIFEMALTIIPLAFLTVIGFLRLSRKETGGNYVKGNISCAPIKTKFGLNFINVLCTAITLVDPESVKNTVKSSVSFYPLGICRPKSCT